MDRIQEEERRIVEAIEEQRRWLNFPTMTEEELLNVEIPEGQLYRILRVNYNNQPSIVRLVRSRDGDISINVDFVQNTFYVRERITRLYEELGTVRLAVILDQHEQLDTLIEEFV